MVIVPSPAPGLGYGGAEYGYSPYGSWAEPRQPYVVSGGYGGVPYGHGAYGSPEITQPRVTSAQSVDGFHFRVYFSRVMVEDAALLDPSSYSISTAAGFVPTILSVLYEGSSVLVEHTGTTLGSQYEIEVSASLQDTFGNLLLPSTRSASFLAFGSVPGVTAAPSSGSTVTLTFTEPILPEADYSPGVEDTGSYEVSTSYPVPVVLSAVSQSSSTEVELTLSGMTSAQYGMVVGPATAFDYDGTALPDEATDFTGVETGTGTSSVSAGGLLLSQEVGNSYGWELLDDTGRVGPSTTLRADFTLDPSTGAYAPPLHDAAAVVLDVSDGVVQVTCTLTRVSGVDVVEVSSGSYFVQVPLSWSSSGVLTISMVRNALAETFSVLADGVPLLSTSASDLTGVAALSPGVRVTLGSAYAVTGFTLRDVALSASSTVFSASWNFLHDVSTTFTGSAENTRASLMTRRGPLVKDWGDPTPAVASDVVVRVNGVEVEVASVNPYIGQVTLAIPVPLTDPGTVTVEVDYAWFPTPTMVLVGLNVPGLVLNKADVPLGSTNLPLYGDAVGVPDAQRFGMSVVLPLGEPARPRQIGHRYIGFQKSYTAALNSPTTLLLNQDPHASASPPLYADAEDVLVSYEGDVVPPLADPAWVLTGVDTGYVDSGSELGNYVLIDDSSGSYGDGQVALYSRAEDLSLPATMSIAARVRVTSWELDGIFTGIAFGVHDDSHLSMAGLLEVSGVKHVGVLLDARTPYLLSSWSVGPSFSASVVGASEIRVTSGTSPSPGTRFQVFDGPQAGTYTASTCQQDDGLVRIDEEFPADYTLWGQREITGYSEVRWDLATTYRMTYAAGTVEVSPGSGGVIRVESLPTYPAQTVLLLPTSVRGAVFWGSVSRVARNSSSWGLVRYGVDYDRASFFSRGQLAVMEGNTLPENQGWFVTEDFGYAEAAADTLLLASTSARPDLDTSYGYAKNLPFLHQDAISDFSATLSVESSSSGYAGAQMRLQDGSRSVLVSTLTYSEDGDYRRILSLPSASITGIRHPEEDGWSPEGAGVSVTLRELPLNVEQEAGGTGLFVAVLDVAATDYSEDGEMEVRFLVRSITAPGIQDGPVFGFSPSGRDVAVRVLDGAVRLVSRGASTTWSAVSPEVPASPSGDYVRVRVTAASGTVYLYVNEELVAEHPTSDFEPGTSPGRSYFGATAASASAASSVDWASANVSCAPPPTALRTFGIRRRSGDASSIDGWEVPRSDSTSNPNSSLSATVVPMDWRSPCDVRVRLDSSWGATLFRPDLAPPPYYDGEFVTEYSEPSAGWVNVEYRALPLAPTGEGFGRVLFGALDPDSITRQRWRSVRCRVLPRSPEDALSKQNHVLNWATVINSGELSRDVTVEVYQVDALTSTVVSLAAVNITASRVFTVTVDGALLDTAAWSFDADAQAVYLASPLPSDHHPVTVAFAPGRPVTRTYLCSRTLAETVTVLNEGTPPVPWSQVGQATRTVTYLSTINDPLDVLGEESFVTNDAARSVTFEDPAGVLYEALDTCSVEEGSTGLIALACDHQESTELYGSAASDALSLPGGPGRWRGTALASDGFGPLNGQAIILSGSSVRQGVLNSGVLADTLPAPGGRASVTSALSGAVSARPEEEDFDFAATVSDDLPPTVGGGSSPDPSGPPSPSGNGSVLVGFADYSALPYAQLAPGPGLTTLGARSLLAGGALTGREFVLAGGTSLGTEPPVTYTRVDAA